jgi:tRNA-splicing ligase RtcB
MAKLKLRAKDLRAIGFPTGKAMGMAINMMLKHYKRQPKEEVIELLKKVLEAPESYQADPVLGRISAILLEAEEKQKQEIPLLEKALEYRTYGAQYIEEGALSQMNTAMRLPIAKLGALMPDAHQGYGLPIGGVLAVENAVIPYGVGMDIGCRMCMTVYDLSPDFLEKNRSKLKDLLLENTRFGKDAFAKPMDDEVLMRPEFKEIRKVKELRGKAINQIGSSGSGNHFVEFGLVEFSDENNEFDLPIGRQYLGILSHSGSRGFGANIASHYTKIARERCLLPKEAQQLAWLSLDSEEGMEYWWAMNLAGDYASACHSHIHARLSKALGEQAIARVENHHNFAWKEQIDDKEYIVHRKGATPAGKGELGIIPGSMTAPGFIVRGKGHLAALNSASHGAGRQMSRRQAKNSFTHSEIRKYLKKQGVTLIGGGIDEAPFAYKDIHQVMKNQTDLVDVLGTFQPKIVRMDKA